MTRLPLLASSLLAFTLAACSSNPPLPPIPRAASVDLPRFMGDWYVIAHTPTFIDKDGYNQIENYRLDDDGSIATTFTFRDGGFDGEPKKHTPRGFVVPGTGNAEWGMQFLWPFKGEFLITGLADDYSSVVIARSKRDMVWLLARKPDMSEVDYARHLATITSMGYDPATLRRVPQRWPSP
jgi:apolipoprotein D and lipocalin family protein